MDQSYEEGYDEEITQEDAWVIISKYFEEKGLVRQQIDSFDEFVNSMIQELVDDAGEVKVVPQDQFNGQAIEMVRKKYLLHSLSNQPLSTTFVMLLFYNVPLQYMHSIFYFFLCSFSSNTK